MSIHRELNVLTSTALRKRMDATADRIVARDKKYHTGSAKLVIRIVDTHGVLRLPDNTKAVMT